MWFYCRTSQGFLGGSAVKNLPAMKEMWVWFLAWEDPLQEEMATHSSILAWRKPWTEKSDKLQSMRSESDMTEWLNWTCDSVDCSLSGSFVHGICQARILEWVAISSCSVFFQPRDWTYFSCIDRSLLYHWATWEALNPCVCCAVLRSSVISNSLWLHGL